MTLAIDIQNLHKTYRNGFVALEDVSLQVNEGDFFALLGPNGAGKSTTIGIITSLVHKTSGTVKIFGYDIDTHFYEAKECLGVVPQEFNFNIFEKPRDILINQAGYYGLPRKLARERAEEMLKRLELWDKRNDPARNLSGGMKRRLMIARALLHKPRILILDEPTAGVDIEIRRSMWEFLKEINREGTTIILTTHYLEEAENLCNTVAIIDKGQLVEDSDMNSLVEKLNRETFILNLAEPIEDLPELKTTSARLVSPKVIEIDIMNKEPLNHVFIELEKHHIHINSMRNKTNRLEELFLDLIRKDQNG